MSNPPELPPQNPDDRPVENPDAVPDQPTEAYASAVDAQTTEAYPPAPEQPAEAYPPAAGAYGPPTDEAAATAAYPPPAYATATAAKSPDTRPRTFGWVSLGLAVAGLVLALLAFLPLVGVSLVLALVGGVLLLAGLVFGIITLVNKKQGGKGLGIGAIVVSVLGGGAWIGALTWSLLLIGLAGSDGSPGTPEPSSTPSVVEESIAPTPDTEPTEGTDDPAAGAYDEAAYLAQVRPALVSLFQEIEPSITEETLQTVLTDETLVEMGTGIVQGGELGRAEIVDSLTESGFAEEQATRFYDTIFAAAQAHLVQ